jgi:DNA-binding YbaB/EbfC family protein
MLKGLGDIGNLLKMQKEFKEVQKRIMNEKRDGESAGGKVTAAVRGDFSLVSLRIDDGFFETADKRSLEQMIMAAVNNAVQNIKDYSADQMSQLTGGLNIPGLGNLFK